MEQGKLIQLLPRKQFEYAFLAAGGSQEVVIAQAVNIIPFYRCKLITRVHDVDTGGSAAFSLTVHSADPTRESTDLFFNTTAAITRSISGTTAGVMHEDNATDVGPYAYIKLAINQDPTTPQSLFCDISIDMLVRAGG